MNMNCAIGHDCKLKDYTSLAPGVNFGGFTLVDTCVDVGIGACTIQNVRIGANSIIGGQSMVVRDVAPSTTVKGVPARG